MRVAHAIILLPPDLASLVLLFEPGLQRLEVFRHGASGNVFAGRILQHLAPIFGGAFFEDVIEPFPDFLVIGIIAGLRRLLQDFARDVIVELELEDGGKGAVVVVGRVIVDVGLGGGVAEFLASC